RTEWNNQARQHPSGARVAINAGPAIVSAVRLMPSDVSGHAVQLNPVVLPPRGLVYQGRTPVAEQRGYQAAQTAPAFGGPVRQYSPPAQQYTQPAQQYSPPAQQYSPPAQQYSQAPYRAP